MPYDGVKETSSPVADVAALSLIETKSDELLYVLLPHSARLAMLEYHLLSKDNPTPRLPVIEVERGSEYAEKAIGTRPARPISVHLSATLPSYEYSSPKIVVDTE